MSLNPTDHLQPESSGPAKSWSSRYQGAEPTPVAWRGAGPRNSRCCAGRKAQAPSTAHSAHGCKRQEAPGRWGAPQEPRQRGCWSPGLTQLRWRVRGARGPGKQAQRGQDTPMPVETEPPAGPQMDHSAASHRRHRNGLNPGLRNGQESDGVPAFLQHRPILRAQLLHGDLLLSRGPQPRRCPSAPQSPGCASACPPSPSPSPNNHAQIMPHGA